jgi:hypothetical protein
VVKSSRNSRDRTSRNTAVHVLKNAFCVRLFAFREAGDTMTIVIRQMVDVRRIMATLVAAGFLDQASPAAESGILSTRSV